MRIAIDTNVLMDYADGVDGVIDAVQTILSRVQRVSLLVTTTVIEELTFALDEGGEKERLAMIALENLIGWRMSPANTVAVDRGICESIGLKIRVAGYLPEQEVNDGLIIAEAAMWGCTMLLSSDAHLLEAGAEPRDRLWRILRECDSASTELLIAKPGDIARRFFHR